MEALSELKTVQAKINEFFEFRELKQKERRDLTVVSRTQIHNLTIGLDIENKKDYITDVINKNLLAVITISQSCIVRVVGENHYLAKKSNNSQELNTVSSVIDTLVYEIEESRFDFQSLERSEIFSDFLEMAEHLLEEGYKDPAAVIVGSTLEEHLKKLSQKYGISVTSDDSRGKIRPKKADALNSELASASAYSKLDQKGVTAWLGLRNEAAHGNYDAYTKVQVESMLQSTRDFISRNPV